MARAARPVVKLSAMEPGQTADFFALLSDKTRGTTQAQKPYFKCKFRDFHRTAEYMVWQDGKHFAECEKEWEPGAFFKLRATLAIHPHYGSQLDVHEIRFVRDSDHGEGFDENEFFERSRFASPEMLAELRTLAEANLADESLKKLVLLLLDRHAEKLLKLPATARHFFPFPGGWLEHTLSVLKNCLWLVDRYRAYYAELQPPLNRDLVVAGAVLHDLGRVAELEVPADPAQPVEQSVPGRLFGHLFLARDLIRDAAREIENLNPELLQLLEHVVITHLSIPEWGSPRLPAIPEVLILHHADDLDAKLEMYARCLRKDISAGPFTERDPVLGRVLLKTREV